MSRWWISTSCFLVLLLAAPAQADELTTLKREVAFVNRTLTGTLKTVRAQLRKGQTRLATANINAITKSLKRLARATKRIRKREPGYAPNPPINFDRTPAASRQSEYANAKKLGITAAKRVFGDYQSASAALQRAKRRQLKTIAISMLKFTIENAPGRQGGKVLDLVVEGVKKLNSSLMDTYISAPITRISEVKLLRNNFIDIRQAGRLMRVLQASQGKLMIFAHKMNGQAKNLQSAMRAEKSWQRYRWLQRAGAANVKVRVMNVRLRDMELRLGGTKLSVASKGRLLRLPRTVLLFARVKGKQAAFIRQKRALAQRSRTIRLHSGPRGGPEDSLVYSSTRVPARSSWLIQHERFNWKPSNNTRIEVAPRAVKVGYWRRERGQVRWTLPTRTGENFSIFVKGQQRWRFVRMMRGRRSEKHKDETSSATLVLKVER
ncbi:MAG: hypothetical protein JRH20_03165 [Deltaproteobacteria bacterium]|nr:hypothetical protein [Deltaproteobacteria bacterium]